MLKSQKKYDKICYLEITNISFVIDMILIYRKNWHDTNTIDIGNISQYFSIYRATFKEDTMNADQILSQAESLVAAKGQDSKMALNKQQSRHLTGHHRHRHCLKHLHCRRGLSAAPEVLDLPQFPSLVWKYATECSAITLYIAVSTKLYKKNYQHHVQLPAINQYKDKAKWWRRRNTPSDLEASMKTL